MFYGYIFSHNHVCNCAIENVILLGFDKYLPKILFIFTLASQSASQLLLRWSFFVFVFMFCFFFFFALSACFGGCMGSADAGPGHEWLSVSLPHSSWPSPEDWGYCFGVRLTPIPPILLFCTDVTDWSLKITCGPSFKCGMEPQKKRYGIFIPNRVVESRIINYETYFDYFTRTFALLYT